MAKKLTELSDTELAMMGDSVKAELNRRATCPPQPGPVTEPDFSVVKKMAVESIETATAIGYMDEDVRQYIWEAVMIAVYGTSFFGWYNKSGLIQ